MYLGSFYRRPNRNEEEYLEAFNKSLTRILLNKSAHVLVGGDFSCGNIEWSSMQVPEGVPNRRVQSQLLVIIQEHCLSQVVNIHTREDKTLDLFFTNFPSPVNRIKGMPPIGKDDHNIVYVEYDIKAKRVQQAPRMIYIYKRADMDGLRDHLARHKDEFFSTDNSDMSVNDMWVSFKSEVIAAIERFIRTKMPRQNITYHGSTVGSDASSENVTNFTFVLLGQVALTLRTITNGSEHMFKKSLGMHTGNIYPISSLLKPKILIPTALAKMKR